MRSYSGYLLDADNTIFDYDLCEREALVELLENVAPGYPAERGLALYREINTDYWRRFELGRIGVEDLKRGRFRDLLSALGATGDAEVVSSRYLEALSRRAHFLPHAEAALRDLSRRARLCLVTNGLSRVQRGRLAAAGIEPRFHAVLISEELGFAKPDPRFFQAAVSAIGLPPRELLCVGDSPTSDIAGARDFGMDTCWVSAGSTAWPGPGPEPTYAIRDLRPLTNPGSTVAQGARI